MAHENASADPAEIDRARNGWVTFTKYTKWMVIHVVVLLLLMAVFLL